ncbi:MAG: hypothetical protein JWM76_4464 [Pseudonocardiales bacterium]|nr:hypothetical protein [Pseudonocardiales bacterium]
MRTIELASHTAHLDQMYGVGVLVRPKPCDDVRDPLSGPSLHAVEWDAVIRHLAELSFQPTEGEHGGTSVVGVTEHGNEVIALYGWTPIVSVPTIEEESRALIELMRTADRKSS